MTAKTYIAMRNLHHDGKAYATGDHIQLTADFADALLVVGAVRELTDTDAKPAPKTKPKAQVEPSKAGPQPEPATSDPTGTDPTVTAVADGAK
jgi:hypothetical protein